MRLTPVSLCRDRIVHGIRGQVSAIGPRHGADLDTHLPKDRRIAERLEDRTVQTPALEKIWRREPRTFRSEVSGHAVVRPAS
jgi:hypothetical protein